MSNLIPAERVATRYPSNPFPDRDIATIDDNDGVRFLFDLSFGYCYPAGDLFGRPAAGDPDDGATIRNMTRQGAGSGDGTVKIAQGIGGTGLTYAGGGFDLSGSRTGISAGPTGVAGPAAALADIWAAAPAGAAYPGASQMFLWCGYFKLPTTVDWAASGAVRTIFSASDNINGYTAAPDLLQIAMRVGSPYQIDARRQVAANTVEATTILQPDAADYGSIVQLAYWRNAAGSRFRLKSDAGVVQSAQTVYAANTQDFSALSPVWGHPVPFYNFEEGFNGCRVYRGWLENLARSGRDPATVLDADWDDVTRRGQFA